MPAAWPGRHQSRRPGPCLRVGAGIIEAARLAARRLSSPVLLQCCYQYCRLPKWCWRRAPATTRREQSTGVRESRPPPRTGSGRATNSACGPRALQLWPGRVRVQKIASAKASPSRQYDETQLLQLPAGRRRDIRRDGRDQRRREPRRRDRLGDPAEDARLAREGPRQERGEGRRRPRR